MTTEPSQLMMRLTPHEVREQLRIHGWRWKSGGAVLGLCIGILSPLIGSMLTAIAWVTGPQWHGLPIQRYGTVLFFLAIPLLIFGAHCLDLIDKESEVKKSVDQDYSASSREIE